MNILAAPLIIDSPDETLGGEWRLAPGFYPGWAAIEVHARGFKTAPDFTLVGHPGDPGMRWASGVAFWPGPSLDLGGADLQGTIAGFPIGIAIAAGMASAFIHDLDVSGAILGIATNGKRWTDPNGTAQEWVTTPWLRIERCHFHDALGGDGFHLSNTSGLTVKDVLSSTQLKLSYQCHGAQFTRVTSPGGNLEMSVDGPGTAWPWSWPATPQHVVFSKCNFLRGLDPDRHPRNLWEVTGNVTADFKDCNFSQAMLLDGSAWCMGAGISASAFGPEGSGLPWVLGSGNTFRHFATPYPNNPEPGGLVLFPGARANWGDAQFIAMNKAIGCKSLVRL